VSGVGWSWVWCGFGLVWCGVTWCGVVWCGVVWCGVVWFGMVWFGVVRRVAVCGLVGAARLGLGLMSLAKAALQAHADERQPARCTFCDPYNTGTPPPAPPRIC